ncbi:MAG TPA: DinB family protein [Fulvivirga sp.]|nr:DinB family protein [Fulvivirga sp.]
MKTIHIILMVMIVPLLSFDTAKNTLSDAERAKAIDYLKSTEADLFAAVKGLTPEQLNFKANSESWSIAECVEHITITEGSIFGIIEESLKDEADPSRRGEVKMTDEQIMATIIDRSQKVKARSDLEPTQKFGTYKETLDTYKKLRKEHIDYVKKTDDDLRNHYFEFPFGVVDSYQVLVFLAGHSKRHILQIEEVKANANFPK